MDELVSKTATTIAEMIRHGRVSPVEVVEAYLQSIDELNPKLNAIVTLAPDAMEKAREAEAAIVRGESCGPLHGVPITIKDTIDTAGLRTTSGSAMRADFVPERDAPAVARLKAAGAIILGKTNCAEMAMDYTADNPVFGRTLNPYNPALTPGGSSGGDAAAIATGMCAAGIGSDLAGSIRIPAHFCGVAGLRPTVGRVPGAGQMPPATGPYSLGAVIGPLARSVNDLKLLFNVLADMSMSTAPSLSGLRAAFYTNDGVAPVTPETGNAVEAAARALGNAGLQVEAKRPPAVERGHEFWLKLFSRASVVFLKSVYGGHEESGGEFVRWRLATADEGEIPTLDDYINFWIERDRLRGTLIDWMKYCPLFIAPVGATAAYAHDTLKVTVGERTMSPFKAFSYAQTFNVFDLPVAVVRAGQTAAGLPIGVQIVGRPFEEETVLAAASIIEEALGGWQIASGAVARP